ncbi:hypothetical protein [Paraburkholderia phenazinium]|jgi:hypothetical protein|uniref:hypothetical protein n=1 Tax=Paraburkholderia phenazinium TaxID=60549 RepID=UPI00115FFDA4|nr:hypothetical protein [Paraburkholderia phenazinium]
MLGYRFSHGSANRQQASEGKQAIGHEDAQPHHDSEVNSANMSDCELSGDLKGFQVIYIPDWKLNEDHRNVSC